MRTAWPLSSVLVVASCVGAPDRWHVSGTWDEAGNLSGNGKSYDSDESYGLIVGVSGALFPSDPVIVHERMRHTPPEEIQSPGALLEELGEEDDVGGTVGVWWQDEGFLAWVERFVLAVLFVIVGRHGESAVKKTAAKVRSLRDAHTTPAP